MALAMEGTGAIDLTALGTAVAPIALAGERIVEVAETFAELFPEGGLVRGRTVACTGRAATSLALALVAPAIAAGSWLAMVDLPTVGLDAARELGVPLERVVAVHAGDDTDRSSRWADVIAAAAGGFDVVMTRAPRAVAPAAARKIAARVRQHDALLIVIGDPHELPVDGSLTAGSVRWNGLGDGHGHLCHRQLTVQASGRRIPGRRACRVALPA